MASVMIASGSKSRITACSAASRGVMRPSSSPSTTAPRLLNRISPGFDPVGAEIDEGADRAVAADDARDDVFIQTVLERENVSVLRQMRRDRAYRALGVVRLHRQEHASPPAAHLFGHASPAR